MGKHGVLLKREQEREPLYGSAIALEFDSNIGLRHEGEMSDVQRCGILVLLWDSDSRVRKFRTPHSDSGTKMFT